MQGFSPDIKTACVVPIYVNVIDKIALNLYEVGMKTINVKTLVLSLTALTLAGASAYASPPSPSAAAQWNPLLPLTPSQVKIITKETTRETCWLVGYSFRELGPKAGKYGVGSFSIHHVEGRPTMSILDRLTDKAAGKNRHAIPVSVSQIACGGDH